MPIVQITALPQPSSVDRARVLERVSLALAAAIGCEAGEVWAVWLPIEAGSYAVDGHAPVTQPQESHPPMARVMAYEGRSAEAIARTVEAVGRTLAGCVGLDPSCVFVSYEELRAGRVFTGGKVRGE